MKSTKPQIDHLYISPKNKDTDIVRKIYLNGGLLSKTSRNQQSKGINAMMK
jgi:hypothetical protein